MIDYLEVSSEKNRDNRFTKEDVLSVSGEYGIVNQIEFQGRSFAGASVSNYGVVENGDVVYTKSPLKSNPYGIIKTNKGIPGIVSTLYAVYKPKEITDSKFVQIYFELDSRMNSYMHPLVNKGAKNDMKVSAENALKGMVSFPKKDEQEIISLYFSTLDNLITLHQWKCEKSRLISKNDWEQRKLGEVCSRVQGNDGRMELPTLTISAANGWMKQEDRFSGNIAGKEQKNYTLLHKGELSYNHGNSKLAKYGTVFSLQTYEEALVPRVYHSFKVEIGNADFIEYYFATKMPDRELRKLISSGARMDGLLNIGYDDFMGIKMMLPSASEQVKIAEYFRSLDHLITLHQWKCEKSRLISKNDWEQRKLGEVFKEYSEKNHTELPALTIIQGGGTVKREESDRNLMYDEYNLSNYKMVRKDDFIVHLRSFEGGLEKSLLDGIISPAYHTFHSDVADSRFYYPYFRSHEFIKHKLVPHVYGIRDGRSIDIAGMKTIEIPYTSIEEQRKIGDYLESLDHLITLHQWKCEKSRLITKNDWEQRKLGDLVDVCSGRDYKHLSEGDIPVYGTGGYMLSVSEALSYDKDAIGIGRKGTIDKPYILKAPFWTVDTLFYAIPREKIDLNFAFDIFQNIDWKKKDESTGVPSLSKTAINEIDVLVPQYFEQQALGEFFNGIDNLITLHQREVKLAEKAFIYTEIQLFLVKEIINMAELEALIEQKLIDQLVYGDSQWTYRQDLKTEADLWNNFRYILEQNNKERLNGEPLTDAEFDQVKNQLQFSSFYKAGEWLVGENGKVMVHVQRDTEKLHLVVMNHEHIAGGSSVYEVINQYQALDTDGNSAMPARDRRFDVTLMINGLPMIHIELKNKQHPYMDGFRQIKKYIGEGKFTGIFSAVQMFVVSNGVDTKYFAAASDRELNDKFISGWVDNDNNPVTDYLDFAKSVLRIPQAHEMIARYTVLDEDAKRLIILRPYQIHAIEAIRDASKNGKSGFVWHTTGSGKTLTSYKATRNLLMDIPSLDKTIFLIDRKDLDTQTTQAFQAYANNDLIDVDETDNVFDLKNKLKSDDRQVIVTTIQKLQILITKRLKEGTSEYDKIKNRRIAFVVDECHRAVTPNTKRLIERFFGRSLWYGFTGTPRFAENPYPQMGDLPRTTEELYGERLHRYTIQNAIHDNAVLGFQVEHNGPKDVSDETDVTIYDNETHMLSVLEIILNRCFNKLGFQNGKGKTYEGLLTVSSIQIAQKYYDLLTRVKNGETSLVIDEKIRQVLPDFPKFAITYSVSENAEGSQVNQQKCRSLWTIIMECLEQSMTWRRYRDTMQI